MSINAINVMNDLKNEQLKNQKDIRERASTEGETHQNLTLADRRLLKAYLGYLEVKGVHDRRPRSKVDAPPFVREALWPSQNEEEEKEEEERDRWRDDDDDNDDDESAFDLQSYVSENTPHTMPRIFEKESFENMTVMFREAAKFDARQQSGIVRSFQVSNATKEKKK